MHFQTPHDRVDMKLQSDLLNHRPEQNDQKELSTLKRKARAYLRPKNPFVRPPFPLESGKCISHSMKTMGSHFLGHSC